MLPIILKIKLTTTAMAGWTAADEPVPMPAEALAIAGRRRTMRSPVEVKLYDENLHVDAHRR